jgi:hypothetical protein
MQGEQIPEEVVKESRYVLDAWRDDYLAYLARWHGEHEVVLPLEV